MANNSLIEILSDILRTANAGYNFDDNGEIITEENWVKPWENQGTPVKNYSQVRGDDKIVSVLNNSSKLQYTNLYDNFIRLLMPKYSRRVEVEDLNRNFWVIAQTLAAVCQYLLRATNVHREVLLLPSDDLHTCVKYDNFDTFPTINGSTIADTEELEQVIFDRLDYLKRSYPNSDLVIIPVIRQGNYYHNYYRREVYLGVYKYNKKEEKPTFDWFYDTNGNIAPIISECRGKENYIFSLNEDQIDLQFYWYYGDNISDLPEDHSRAYVTAFRATPTFENDDSTQIKIVVKDAIGDAIKNAIDCEQVYTEIYTINYTNNKYVWTKETVLPIVSGTTSGKIEIESKVKGYYLGELSSERGKIMGGEISDYSLSIVEHNLRPVSPSYYQIYYILQNLHKIGNCRGNSPDSAGYLNNNNKLRKKFLPNNGSAGESGKAINFYQLFGLDAEETTEHYEPYGQGIDDDNNYQTYKNINGSKTLTQHGEDTAVLDLYKKELQVQGTKNIVLHLFNHAMLLQKISGGTAENKSDKLKNVMTVHSIQGGVLEIERNKNRNSESEFLDDYIVYEYDGYLTGTSQNSSLNAAQTGFKSGFGKGSTQDPRGTNYPIDQATPRRDNQTSYFDNWEYEDTPLELVVIDNGEIASRPKSYTDNNDESKNPPRFSGGLEQYTYGAIVQIPYKTNQSLCYNFEYNFFENALQDSCAFWRGVFELKAEKLSNSIKYTVGNENYGRKHNVYTNAQYFINNTNSKDMIIKITNIGITFGPSLQYFKKSTSNLDPYRTDYTPFNDLPSEYQYGFKNEITENGDTFIRDYDNWITFDKNKLKSEYYNSAQQPKHLSPLAPVAAYGWPIRSAVDTDVTTVYSWTNSSLVGNNSDGKLPATLPNDKITMKKFIETLPSNEPNSPEIEYSPLLAKPGSFTKRGYTSSILPVQCTNDNKRVMKLPNSKFETIKTHKHDFEVSGPGTTEALWTIGTYNKGEDGSTLNEGKYYKGCGQSKYYGITTIVHTIYVKVDLTNDAIPCQTAICTVKRLNKETGDYRPILETDNNNRLTWHKNWNSDNFTGHPSQGDIETMLSQAYSLKAATGDFVNDAVNELDEKENVLIYDFAKYPSNGMCPIQYIDPADLYSRGNGPMSPTTVAPTCDKDMTLDISLPEQPTYGNYALTGNTITGTSSAQQDTKYYVLLALQCTDDESTETIPSVQYTINGSVLTPESDVFKVEIQTGTDTITISAEHNGYCTVNKTLTVTVQPEPAPIEENTPSEENPE